MSVAAIESKFERETCKELKNRYPGCIIEKNDPRRIQGIPDRSIFLGPKYAMLEFKRSEKEAKQPNQEYYIGKINNMGGFARFIFPENKEYVLHELDIFFNKDK